MDTNQTSEKPKLKRRLKIGCLSVMTLFLVGWLIKVLWVSYMIREVEVCDENLIYEPAVIPEEKNGYFILDAACMKVVDSEMDLDVFSETNRVPSDETLVALSSFYDNYPEVLDSFYSAAQYEHCWTPLNLETSWIEQDLMSISGVIALGHVSLCNIKNLVQKKDYHQALDRLHSHLRLGRMINADAHNQITGALGLVLTSKGTSLLTDYLSSGTFSYEYRDEVWNLYILLRDHSAWEHMICAEYSYTKNTLITTIARVSSLSEMHERKSRFLYNESLTLRSLTQDFSAILKSCREPEGEFQAVRSEQDKEPNFLDRFIGYHLGNYLGRMYYAGLRPSRSMGSRILKEHTGVDLLGVYLALWDFYRATGQLPERLSELVPQYMTELPSDPYANGEAFFYNSEKKLICSACRESANMLWGLEMNLGFVD